MGSTRRRLALCGSNRLARVHDDHNVAVMSGRLTVISSYADPIEAEMVCEYLRSHGIRSEIGGGTNVNVFGAGHSLTAQMLLVDAEQVAAARTLLAGYAGAGDAGVPAEEPAGPAKRFDGYFESDWNERERAVESAYRASVIGWFVPFVSWWGLWEMMRVLALNLPLRPERARRAKLAGAIMAGPATLYLVLIILFLTR